MVAALPHPTSTATGATAAEPHDGADNAGWGETVTAVRRIIKFAKGRDREAYRKPVLAEIFKRNRAARNCSSDVRKKERALKSARESM